MAGTSRGMWGRSSSGPAAAASLQVVSRARARTSDTWEPRPARAGRQAAIIWGRRRGQFGVWWEEIGEGAAAGGAEQYETVHCSTLQ